LFYRIIGPPIMAILRDFVSGKVSGSRFFDTEASAQAAAQVDPLASQMMVNPSTVYVPETTTVFRTGDPGGPCGDHSGGCYFQLHGSRVRAR
jgi:hypothetical protein